MIVIPSSVVPPVAKFEPIRRKALMRMLPEVARSRVTSVTAPAGFGKTTAIRLWTEELEKQGRPVIWLAGRAIFANLEQFLMTLCEAGTALGFAWADLAPGDLQPRMLHDFAIVGDGAPVLVIEDTQFLPSEVTTFVGTLIANARDSLTTILSTRGRSSVPMARLRALGCLFEVDARHLRFSAEETASLISTEAEGPVDVAWIDMVHTYMAGWPTGTMMAARIPPPRNLANARNERDTVRLSQHLKQYFEEEVLSQLSDEMMAFLTDISILPRFGRAEAQAVTLRADSGQYLESILDLGLFIQGIEDERGVYRFHPLFGEMLHDRLLDHDAERACLLHKRAAGYYLRQDQAVAAVEQADASRDLEFLADTLDGVAEQMTYAGNLMTVVRLAEKLPWPILSRQPGIMLCLAWRHIRALAFNAAEELLAATDVELQRRRADPDGDVSRLSKLELLLRHRRALLLAARDDMPEVERVSETLLAEFGDDNTYVSCTLLAQLMAARRELFHFHDTLKLEAETRRALGRPGSQFASIALKASIAPTLAMQGKTATARSLLEEALALAESYQGPGSGLAALPALPLAELCYDLGELDRARDLVDRHLHVARELGYTDQLCAGHLVRARLLAADGDSHGALKVLDEAQLVALECGLDRLRSFAVALQVQFLLREDQRDEAQRVFVAAGFDLAEEPIPTMTPSRCQEAAAVAWIRLEVREHRLVRAHRIAKRWQDLVKRSGATRSVVLFELILAEIVLLSGEASEARRHVRSAVATAADPGWVRLFVDGGEMIGNLLQEAYLDSPLVDTVADRFAARLIGESGFRAQVESDDEEVESGLSDRIAGREIEILSLVSGGLRNREIGYRLGLTEGTVKWYMQQIYDKLGVRRRPQAVTRARALGLLN